MYQLFKKATIMLLISMVAIGMTLIEPITAIAAPGDNPSKMDPISSYDESKIQSVLDQTSGEEKKEKRESNSKEFLLEDGSTEVVLFAWPVHYYQDGEYKEIDNSLDLVSNDSGEQVYKNKANNYSIEIGADYQKGNGVKLTKGKNKIEWVISSISGSSSSRKDNDSLESKADNTVYTDVKPSLFSREQWEKATQDEKRRSVPNLSSEVMFSNVIEGVDLQYIVLPDRVKENLIINSYTDVAKIDQRILADGLKLFQDEFGNIEAFSSENDELVFVLPAPYMIDSKGNESSIEFTLIEEKGCYVLSYNLDQKWLEEALYPVTIDPQVTISNSDSNLFDNRVYEGAPASNYRYSYANITGSVDQSSAKENYALIRFATLPSGYSSGAIYYARLTAQMNWEDATAGNQIIDVHRVTESWDPADVTWNNRPTYESTVRDSETVTATLWATYYWNITKICRDWYQYGNYGLLLKDHSTTGLLRSFVTSNAGYGNPPSAYFLYDSAAPVAPTSLTTEPVATSIWTNDKSPTITWSGASDGSESGLSSTAIVGPADNPVVPSSAKAQWTINGGTTWASITNDTDYAAGSFTLPDISSTSGTYTIGIKVLDRVGRASTVKNVTYKLDVDAPTAPTNVVTTTSAVSSWTSEDTVSLSWSGITDATSGLSGGQSHAEYQIDGTEEGEWIEIPSIDGVASGTTSLDCSAINSGVHTIYIRAVDAVGNEGATGSVIYQLDVDGPDYDVTISPQATESWVNDSTPTITWSNFTDSYSGIKELMYKVDDSTWASIENSDSASGSFELPELTNSGIYTIKVVGIDNCDNPGDEVSIQYRLDMDLPDSVDNLTAVVSDDELNKGDTASISLTFDLTSDNPSNNNSGIKEYQIEKKIGDGEYTSVGISSNGTFNLDNQPDNSRFTFRIRARDNAGNFSDWVESSSVISLDRTAPGLATSFTINYDDWTNDTTPIVSWAGFIDGEDHFDCAQYRIVMGAEEVRSWTDIGGASGTAEIYFALSEEDGEYSIEIRGKDIAGNTGDALSVMYKKDTQAPQMVLITAPSANEYIDSFYDIKGIINDERFFSWRLEWGLGETPTSFTDLAYSLETVPTDNTLFSWNASELVLNEVYTLRLHVLDTANNECIITRLFRKGYDPNPVIDESLQIDNPTTILDYDPTVSFNYQRANSGGNTGLLGKLYLSGQLKGQETQVGQGFSVDMTPYTEGSIVKFFVISTDQSGNSLYSCKTQDDSILNDLVANTNNFEIVSDLVVENGIIKLASDANGFLNTGYFVTNPMPVCKETFELLMNNIESLPNQTNIDYFYSVDNGVSWIAYSSQSTILNSISSIKVKGVFTTQLSTSTPSIDTIAILARYFINQSPLTVLLVDNPSSVSSMANVNHSILLRWEASNASNATYTVYRSTSETGEYVAVASDISDLYWYDYTLDYGQTFYYLVKAKATIAGQVRESIASNVVSETVVSENEIDKMIGNKAPWNFVNFGTGSGTGSANIVSGNLYYQTTDFSQYSPGMDMNLVRTYNSQATYKTPLGYGWDYSYNISLLKEYDSSSQEIAMILKMGDGTMYRFLKTGENQYARPVGTYMDLASIEGIYKISFKGGVQYLFNANLRIGKISDANGNDTSFEYDSVRGNLSRVYDEVGNQIVLGYSDSSNNQEVDRLISVTDANGNVFHYIFNETTRKVSEGFIWFNENLNDKYGEGYTYNAAGLLWKVSNPAGYITTIDYSNGKMFKATNPMGEELIISYSANIDGNTNNTTSTFRYATTIYHYTGEGIIQKLTDPLGYFTEFDYDENYNVIQTKYHNRVGNVDNVEIKSSCHYDSNGNLLWSEDPYGYKTYYVGYNSFGSPSSVIKPFVDADSTSPADIYVKQDFTYYDTGALETTSKMAKGTYNDQTGVFSQIGDSVGSSAAYSYDDFGNVLTESTTTGAGANTVTSTNTYVYDAQGRLIKTIVLNPYTSETTETVQHYNDKGYIDWSEDEKKTRTMYTYDTIGRKVTTRTAGKDGIIIKKDDGSIDDGDDIVETLIYDKNDNITRTLLTYLDGSTRKTDTTIAVYDVLGRCTDTTTAAGTLDASTSHTAYGLPDLSGNYIVTNTDGEGVATSTTYNANGWATHTSGDSVSSTTIYDKCGNVIQTVSNDGLVCITEYDKLGRTTKTISDPGTSPEHKNTTTVSEYDLLGNVKKSIDTDGNTAETVYDAASRPIQVISTDYSLVKVDPNAEPVVSCIAYEYDLVDSDHNRITRSTDGVGHVKEVYYNVLDQLVKEIDKGDPNNTNNMVTSYTYNAKGAVLTKTAPDGTVTTYEYNDDDSLKKMSYSTTFYVEYTYYGDGSQKSVTQTKDGIVTSKEFINDSQGRVIEVKQDGITIIKYDYTDNDCISEMIYPQDNGPDRVISFVYDFEHDGRLVEIRDNTDDEDSKLIRKYNYNSEGQLVTLEDFRKFDQSSNDGDYTEQSFGYDQEDGMLTSVVYTDKDYENDVLQSSTIKESYSLEFYDDGNIKKETSYTNYTTAKTTVKDYEYDGFGRLIEDSVTVNSNPTTVTSYEFDNVGNRTSLTIGSVTTYYDYNEFNSLMRIASDSSFNNILMSYTYDDRGNQTTQTDEATNIVTTYAYDLANRLSSVTRGATTLGSYWYDGAGQRVKKQEGTVVTNFYYDGLSLLYTEDGAGQRLEENIMEPDGSAFLTKRFTGNYINQHYFFRQDIRGSITNVIKDDASVLVGQDYDTYGKTTKTGDAGFVLSFGYSGAVIDEVTGLYYMNARYYNPETGSFLTRDTVEGQLAYGYCDGDPTNNTDPSGHCTRPTCPMYGVHYGGPCPVPGCSWPDAPGSTSEEVAKNNRFKRLLKYFSRFKTNGRQILEPNFYKDPFGFYFYRQQDYTNQYINKFWIDGSAKCGDTTFAMIASTYEKGKISPYNITRYLHLSNGDTGNGLFEKFIKEFEYTAYWTKSYKAVMHFLSKDFLVAKHSKGHWIAIQKRGNRKSTSIPHLWGRDPGWGSSYFEYQLHYGKKGYDYYDDIYTYKDVPRVGDLMWNMSGSNYRFYIILPYNCPTTVYDNCPYKNDVHPVS